MDYDTWKTTDFEAEAADKADRALEAAQSRLADDMFDAYVEGVPHVVEEVDDWLANCSALPELLRAALARDCEKPVGQRGQESYYAVCGLVSSACKEIASRFDTLEKVEDFWV